MTAADFRRTHGDPQAVVHLTKHCPDRGWSAGEMDEYLSLALVDDYVRRHPDDTARTPSANPPAPAPAAVRSTP